MTCKVSEMLSSTLQCAPSLPASPHWKRTKSRTRAPCSVRYWATVLLGSGRKDWGSRRVSASPQGRSSMLPRDTGASPTTCCPSFLPRVSSAPSLPPWNTTKAPYRPWPCQTGLPRHCGCSSWCAAHHHRPPHWHVLTQTTWQGTGQEITGNHNFTNRAVFHFQALSIKK